MSVTDIASRLAPSSNWKEFGPPEHFVQFYEREDFLLDFLTGFIGDGLVSGKAGIVIATRPHLEELERRWQARGLNLAAASAQGQYMPLEAAETLSKIMVEGSLQPSRFEDVIGNVIRITQSRYTRILAFGEIVALLWRAGKQDAALQLEKMWCGLVERCPISLFCAYPMSGFRDSAHRERFAELCATHTRVVPAEGYTRLTSADERLRHVCELQQSAGALEREVQERQASQRALARQERDLAEFLDNAIVCMHMIGPDGTILWANKAELDMLGYTREEYIGQHIAKFHVDAEVIGDILRRLHAGESLYDVPARLRRKDGSIRHVLIHSNALWEDGKFIHTRCFTRDITEHKQAEEVRAHLAAIVESSEDAIISKDLNGTIRSWNRGAERLFGYTAQEMIGQPIMMLIPPEKQYEEPSILDRLNRGERIEHYETVRRRKDGSLVEISLTVSAIKDRDGCVIGASKIARDISERKRLERELQDKVLQLAEADRRKDEFLAMLGHELRNPLAPIRNVAEVLRRRTSGDSSDQQLYRMLARQVQHMTRLLDDLLDVGRITHGKIQLRYEPLELMAVVARAIETSRPYIEKRRHRLTVQLPREPVRIRGDLMRLVQMIANLLNNAAKYTPEGGEIFISVQREDSKVAVRVQDNGAGIRPDMLPRVFDLFAQADRTLERSDGGLGIGLTLVRRIAELHQGEVEALSDGPGRGSTFVVRLPVMPGKAANLAGRDAHEGDGAQPVIQRSILVVDDNTDAAESMTALLRLSGHEVETAPDGPAAIEIFNRMQPEFVLLDIGLPGMNGYEVARRLRAQGCTARLVALTGYGQPEDRRCTQQAGFDRHLVKPVEPEAVERLLREQH